MQLLKMLRNCCITLEAQFLWKMMNNITHLDYESEATEDWVCSGMSSFKMPVVGRKKNPPKIYIIFVFPTVNVFLEGDRAGSWWKPFIFLDEAGRLRAQRLRAAQNDVRWGPEHPPLNVILRGPIAKSVQSAQNS